MLKRFDKDGIDFEYNIIRKKNTKHLYIRIKDSTITVTANSSIPDRYIDEFLYTKSKWIKKHLQNRQAKKLLTDTDAKVYFLGKAYRIRTVLNEDIKKEYMVIDGEFAIFRLKQAADHNRMSTIRDAFYKAICGNHITPIADRYSKIMKLYPSRISYRNNRSRWGSCSSKNSISLNSRLMMLPVCLIEYVVIHELAHIKHKNHSTDFWEEVSRYCPLYKKHRKDLRDFEYLL